MTEQEKRRRMHDLDVTVWVGKHGVEAVVEELSDQLDDRDMVKVKFLRAARGGTTTEDLAEDLAERVGGDLARTRGHTAVIER
ncbi:RNA-binding protein [Halorientalis sp. IM1011]|uniref:YhbY family RNA-binding protein n=1 Tax=Halorientalis sp. IM1011 TaxID=1932360 RepID=UPI00097CC216|nr:YhbY family RNA-binding protein [Halorientalis sp. IM1011]AQL43855.1 RNA-binding protein [Halorientalis sp. IM1011]